MPSPKGEGIALEAYPMTDLAKKHCVPCEGGAQPLPDNLIQALLKQTPGWKLAEGPALRQELRMKDFMAAVRFVNDIAKLAESEDHHPDIHLTGYRNLRIELSTHAIGGLSENDFILAAKIDELPRELKA